MANEMPGLGISQMLERTTTTPRALGAVRRTDGELRSEHVVLGVVGKLGLVDHICPLAECLALPGFQLRVQWVGQLTQPISDCRLSGEPDDDQPQG